MAPFCVFRAMEGGVRMDAGVCARCGAELTEQNSYERADGVSRYCAECEEDVYASFAERNGYSLGLWMACVRFNVPLEPMLIPADFGTPEFAHADGRWNWYNEMLYDGGHYEKEDGGLRGFADGVTSLLRIFGKELTERDFARYCRVEMERIEKLPGTAEQRKKWTMRPIWKNVPVTSEIYDELDRSYAARAAQFRGQTITVQMEETLRRVCKLSMAQDHLQAAGDAGAVDRLQKTIDNMLASEQLRKKDEKPVEGMRVDALVDALERAGVMEQGMMLSLDEVIHALEENFIRKPKYHGTIDVVDQVVMDLYNTMRANADLFLLSELPEELTVEDTYREFDGEETEEQRRRMKYAGLMPLRHAGQDREGGEGGCPPDTPEKGSDTPESSGAG